MLNSTPGPITDQEIEQFHTAREVKSTNRGDTSDATVEVISTIHAESAGKGCWNE